MLAIHRFGDDRPGVKQPAMLPAPPSGPDQFHPVIPIYSGSGGRGLANLAAGRSPGVMSAHKPSRRCRDARRRTDTSSTRL
jgi:hypothetical protein